jgi:alkanesulfonate monooxygenase SsuD/methylene tetrahydromethanopterin reductase-like flavin-dependent oxidoreductase (luciferase family)
MAPRRCSRTTGGWETLGETLRAFNKIRAAHGWPASPSAIATTVHVHRDGARARETGARYWRKTSAMTMWHYDRLGSEHFMPGATAEERERTARAGYEDQASAGLFGSPAEVIEQIRELQRVADVGHLITLHSLATCRRTPWRRACAFSPPRCSLSSGNSAGQNRVPCSMKPCCASRKASRADQNA